MKIDHIAIPVSDIYEACGWYRATFQAKTLYYDEIWGNCMELIDYGRNSGENP